VEENELFYNAVELVTSKRDPLKISHELAKPYGFTVVRLTRFSIQNG